MKEAWEKDGNENAAPVDDETAKFLKASAMARQESKEIAKRLQRSTRSLLG